MIQYLTVTIEDVYTGIGTVYHDYPADARLKPARPWDKLPAYGLLLYWPKIESWLEVEVLAQAKPTTPPISFASHPEAVEAICRTHGVDSQRIAPAGFLAAANIRVGSSTPATQMTLRFAIDTSHDRFKELVRERAQGGQGELVQTIQVRMFDTKSLNSAFEQVGTIQLFLRPACPIPPYYGVVAVDLGNTSSDLACISKRDPIYRTDSLRLLEGESPRPSLGAQSSAVGSAVRIDRIVSHAEYPPGIRRFPDLPEDDLPRAIQYVTGRLATAGQQGVAPGLILGAKRLVSGQEADRFRPLVVEHDHGNASSVTEEEIYFRNRLPAELLACRLFEKFRQAAKAWPGELAVTYPTTYTPRELSRLCQAVERGWLRMQGLHQALGIGTQPDNAELARLAASTQSRLMPGGDVDTADAGVIRLRLDEATAAAYFFLFRRVFESPGGLLRFRYLYPSGLNLLLYDCGGGTTDIALVRVRAISAQHLTIGVLGRTGLRSFGGDDITAVVARLLKAKLLAELLRIRGKLPPNSPGNAADPQQARQALDAYLRKIDDLDPDDRWIPTRFDPKSTDGDTRNRRRYAHELWQWAEKVKADLAAAPNGSVKFEGVQKFRDPLAEPMFLGLTETQVKAIEAQLKSVTLHRWEVDTLVDIPTSSLGRTAAAPIRRSIEKCNRLIQDLLRDRKVADGLPEEEVHWVVLSGNAARYPLIRERIVSDLHVDDLEERLTLDEMNLKHAVAKGAALFLLTTRTPGTQVVIETEVDLSACLPFDVGYFDLAKREHRLLYREHQKYQELAPQRIPVQRNPNEDMRTIYLERRFPGDDEYSRFLAFEFRDPIQGDVEIRYDASVHEFTAIDSLTGMPGETVDLTENDVYVAPSERGLI